MKRIAVAEKRMQMKSDQPTEPSYPVYATNLSASNDLSANNMLIITNIIKIIK